MRKTSSGRGVHVTLDLADGVSLRATRTPPVERKARSRRWEQQRRDNQKRIQHLEDLVARLATNTLSRGQSPGSAAANATNNVYSRLTQARVASSGIESIRGRLRMIAGQLRGLEASRRSFVVELKGRVLSLKRDLLRSAQSLAAAKRVALRSRDAARLAQIRQSRDELSMQRDTLTGQLREDAQKFKAQLDAQKSTLLSQLATAQDALRLATNAARQEPVLERNAAARRA